MKMLKERLAIGSIEPSHGHYRNPWYVVGKKEKGKYRLINACTEMNLVTLRDANLPPNADDFAENFAGCAVASLVDWFSGYDQIMLAVESRDHAIEKKRCNVGRGYPMITPPKTLPIPPKFHLKITNYTVIAP